MAEADTVCPLPGAITQLEPYSSGDLTLTLWSLSCSHCCLWRGQLPTNFGLLAAFVSGQTELLIWCLQLCGPAHSHRLRWPGLPSRWTQTLEQSAGFTASVRQPTFTLWPSLMTFKFNVLVADVGLHAPSVRMFEVRMPWRLKDMAYFPSRYLSAW